MKNYSRHLKHLCFFLCSILISVKSWSAIELISDLREAESFDAPGGFGSGVYKPPIPFSSSGGWTDSVISPDLFKGYISSGSRNRAQFGFTFKATTSTVLDMTARIESFVYGDADFNLWTFDPTTNVKKNLASKNFKDINVVDPSRSDGTKEDYLLNELLVPGSYGLTWSSYGGGRTDANSVTFNGTFADAPLAPVPLPSALLLSASALLSLFGFCKKKVLADKL